MRKIPSEVTDYINKLKNEECCLKRVWRRRSLTLGFGNKVFHKNDSLVDDFNGEWEFRTYYSSWRIVQHNIIVCASNQTSESINEIQKIVDNIALGKFKSLSMLSEFDISVELSNDIRIDFLATDNDPDEEILHIFCPNNIFIGYSVAKGWEVSLSDVPKL